MYFAYAIDAAAVALLIGLVVLREVLRRASLIYEYRWETFAVRGPGGRQLLHIRQTEIESLRVLTFSERFSGYGRFKQLSRRTFGPRVVIRSKVAHTIPMVISWEGRAIAGLAPRGLKLNPGEEVR